MSSARLNILALTLGLLFLAGCPTGTTAPDGDSGGDSGGFAAELINSLDLFTTQSGGARPLAIDSVGRRGYVADGKRLRPIDLGATGLGTVGLSDFDVRAMSIVGDRSVIVLDAAGLTRYDPTPLKIGETQPLSTDFNSELVRHSDTGRMYARDGLAGEIHEIDPVGAVAGGPRLLRTIDYRDRVTSFPGAFSNQMAIDSATDRLFVMDSSSVLIVDISEAASGRNTTGFDPGGQAEGVIIDADRRRLYVNLLFAGTATSAARVRCFDLDTLDQKADRVLGNQIHWMALDAQRGRLAVNTRLTTSFATPVFLLDLSDLSLVPFDLVLADEGQNATIDARMRIDTVANRLLVARAGATSRVEVYSLPE